MMMGFKCLHLYAHLMIAFHKFLHFLRKGLIRTVFFFQNAPSFLQGRSSEKVRAKIGNN